MRFDEGTSHREIKRQYLKRAADRAYDLVVTKLIESSFYYVLIGRFITSGLPSLLEGAYRSFVSPECQSQIDELSGDNMQHVGPSKDDIALLVRYPEYPIHVQCSQVWERSEKRGYGLRDNSTSSTNVAMWGAEMMKRQKAYKSGSSARRERDISDAMHGRRVNIISKGKIEAIDELLRAVSTVGGVERLTWTLAKLARLMSSSQVSNRPRNVCGNS
ncbi:hypothetical protein BD309DRAFT_912758 [Dichomitus squalens]|uniref:Uncharacterized protein n=1 Tax=Dichomitus squalens TaxID=114155 RepID=A0A4Q9P240_9APHY|nr:hypothetical protein BD309DRAFT_912758 [Dichomitus squalens]TBU59371.1 hypothetical protein BD310DRAFT_877041 [Dichomitus squalens]